MQVLDFNSIYINGNLIRQSALSQKKYAHKNGFSQQALSTWKDVKCPS